MADAVKTSDFDQQVLQSDTPVLVDFWAEWCGPCKVVDPIVEEIGKEQEGKLKVVKLNVDEEPDLSKKYNVMSIPTLILFKGGDPVETVIGVHSKADLEAKFQPHL